MSAHTETGRGTPARPDRFARNGDEVGEMQHDRRPARDRFARNVGAGRHLRWWLRRLVEAGALASAALGASAGRAAAQGKAAATSATAVVNPGMGIAPPGSQQLTTILSYLAWGVTATCVAGVLIVASKMALNTRGHPGGSEHAGALMWVLVAAVVAGSASALVGALI